MDIYSNEWYRCQLNLSRQRDKKPHSQTCFVFINFFLYNYFFLACLYIIHIWKIPLTWYSRHWRWWGGDNKKKEEIMTRLRLIEFTCKIETSQKKNEKNREKNCFSVSFTFLFVFLNITRFKKKKLIKITI